MEDYPCLHKIDRDCFKAHPAWAKQAFAYRLVYLLTPGLLTKRLPKGLRRALLAPGVVIPPGVEVPGGFILGPGAELPTDWVPWGLPGEILIPPAELPPGEAPAPGVEMPPGVIPPPVLPPGVEDTGPTPPLYVAPGEPGPLRPPVSAPPPGCISYFDNTRWTATKGSWDSANKRWQTEEIAGGGWVLQLTKLGTWVNGFRPATFIITFEGAAFASVALKDSDNGYIYGPGSNIPSDQVLTIVWAGYNIDALNVYTSVTAYVTNIRFCP